MILETAKNILSRGGNDTIDCYPPWDIRIEKILCVTGKVFKKIQWDFYRFLKDNKASCKSKPKRKRKPPTKAIKVTLPKNNFEPSTFTDKIYLCRNHRISRMKDWHGTYGQGMYE